MARNPKPIRKRWVCKDKKWKEFWKELEKPPIMIFNATTIIKVKL